MSSSSSWIGGLDVHQWAVTQMGREYKNYQDASDIKKAGFKNTNDILTNQLKVYNQLQSLIAAFQTSITAVNTAFNGSYQVTSSNTSAATAEVSGSATSGTHTLVVNQLAKAESIASQNIAAASPTATTLGIAETLNISVGAGNFSVPIATGDSLQAIANNINIGASANNVGVTASVMATSTGNYRLVISSNQTGLANAVVVNETNITGNALNITTTGGGGSGAVGTVLSGAQDALFVFDNIPFQQSSNANITIQGMNIKLTGDNNGAGNAQTTIVVNSNTSVANATTAIQNFICAYNQIDTLIEQFQAQSSTTDSGLSSVLSAVQAGMHSVIGSGAITNLADLGITGAKTMPTTIVNAEGVSIQYNVMGQLSLKNNASDTGTVLQDALTNSFSQVQSFFTAASGMSATLTDLLTVSAPPKGMVASTISNSILSINQQLDGVVKDNDDEIARMDKVKKDLVIKYAALESSLTKMQITSQYLSSQISTYK